MTNKLLVRPAEPSDAAVIAKHRYFRPDDAETDVSAYKRWVERRLEVGTYLGVLAVQSHHVLGGAGLVFLDWGPSRGDPSPTRARIVNVFVEPDSRRQGVATQLLQALVKRCQDRGIAKIGLAATAGSQALYERLGFKPAESEMLLVQEVAK